MAKFVSGDKNSLMHKFNSLDVFTRLFIVTIILLAIASPFVIYNIQLFNARGESQTERLQEIQGLQQSQSNYQKSLARANGSAQSAPDEALPSKTAGKFNLIDALQQIIIRIIQFFGK